jgi:hypothetical protein
VQQLHDSDRERRGPPRFLADGAFLRVGFLLR